jgi:hypothetical protein
MTSNTVHYLDRLFTFSIDKISINCTDPNPENVTITCQHLVDAQETGEWPGSKLKSGRRHHLQVAIPTPGNGLGPAGTLLLQAGPRFKGIADYRIEFNPARIGPSGVGYVIALLDSVLLEGGRNFFLDGTVTRIDLALDLNGLSADDAIIRSRGQRKHGVFSDQAGKPQTVYLGGARSSQTAAYTKPNGHGEGNSLRIERRMKPRCLGSNLVSLANPFPSVQIVHTRALLPCLSGLDAEHFFDSVRVRGFTHVLAKLPPSRSKAIGAVLKDPTQSLLPPMEDIWLGWPQLLQSSGFGFLLPAISADVSVAPEGPVGPQETIEITRLEAIQFGEGQGADIVHWAKDRN